LKLEDCKLSCECNHATEYLAATKGTLLK
jgi:hypothetical protein